MVVSSSDVMMGALQDVYAWLDADGVICFPEGPCVSRVSIKQFITLFIEKPYVSGCISAFAHQKDTKFSKK
jgi:hypothetical protein